MVAFILHTHLPYVLNHGTWPHGSDWLCEAVAECYVPLLSMCDRLVADGIRPGVTFDISPVLTEQLSHPSFAELFLAYCTNHAALAEGDALQFEERGEAEYVALAQRWAAWYTEQARLFKDVYHSDIVGSLRRLQDAGQIEVMTCGLTHGYLPLIAEDVLVDAQVDLAVKNYERHFGRRPHGIWLPECAYRPAYPWHTYLPHPVYSQARPRRGIEQMLQRHQLSYFVTDQAALEQSRPLGVDVDGVRTPWSATFGDARAQLDERSPLDLFRVGSPDHAETCAVFTRHRDIALQVWSGTTGYPGDADYLDFHKKYFRSSMRYWRVTDNTADMQHKQAYVWEWAAQRAEKHAAHYAAILTATVAHRRTTCAREPVVALPFDTELFGHWWFEGPIFLEHVLRNLAASSVDRAVTAHEAYQRSEPSAVVALPESSWGRNGTHEVWMNPDVHWLWEREYRLEYRLRMFHEKHRGSGGDATVQRILTNAWRECFLAQASDWPFLISTFSSREYAEKRIYHHAEDCERLCDIAERYCATGTLQADDETFVHDCEERNGIFTHELQAWITNRYADLFYHESGL